MKVLTNAFLRHTASIALMLCVSLPMPVFAAEIAGLRIEDQIKIGNTEMHLNGAGLRSKFIFKVYMAALYLPHKSSNPNAIIQTKGLRRITLRMLRDVDGDALLEALKEGLHNNHNETEMQTLQVGLTQLATIFQGIGNTKTGDLIILDFNDDGLNIVFNAKPINTISDEAFARALLKVWLGEKPVEASLKKALLGSKP
jgi:hypothetical protein